jgi:hypothetical protein
MSCTVRRIVKSDSFELVQVDWYADNTNRLRLSAAKGRQDETLSGNPECKLSTR